MLGKTAAPQHKRPFSLFAAWCVSAALFFSGGLWVSAREPSDRVTDVMSSSQTVMGETIAYPSGSPAKVTAIVLTLQPGQETGWHTHGVPAFGFVLEGELTVDYGTKGSRVYKTSEGVLEAMAIAHNGRNSGAVPMRILAVFMGADGRVVSEPVAR
jgi:quercetin dioxygenase-like cupin family protein